MMTDMAGDGSVMGSIPLPVRSCVGGIRTAKGELRAWSTRSWAWRWRFSSLSASWSCRSEAS